MSDDAAALRSKTDNSERRTSPVLPRGLRIFAIITGLFAGVTFVAVVIPWLLALMLIVGAAVQPWSHRAGKWLLAAGALTLTPMSVMAIVSSLELRNSYSSDWDVLRVLVLVLSILVVSCDIWLIAYLVRSRHVSQPQKPDYFPPVNYFVWLVAAGASAVFIPVGVRQGILFVHHVVGTGPSDLILFVLPGLVLTVLDVALLMQGIRALYAYLFHRHTTAA